MDKSNETKAKAGIGNWDGFLQSGVSLDQVIEVAQSWKREIHGIDKPWLCWNVNNDWSLVQQRLVEFAGWTPVVGFDPRVGPPSLSKNAVLVDFNKGLDFPVMYPHFPIEFTFAFAPRLAFWHSDLIIRKEKMLHFASLFENLKDNQMAATKEHVGLLTALNTKKLRLWELLGCMTKGASLDNFEKGCGWWLNFYNHPNCPSEKEKAKRKLYHWECGVGIRYWQKRYSGNVVLIDEQEIDEGHFTRINNKQYVAASPNDWRRDISKDLIQNFELANACNSLKLQEFLHAES